MTLTKEAEALLNDLIGTVEANIAAETWNDEQARANLSARLAAIEDAVRAEQAAEVEAWKEDARRYAANADYWRAEVERLRAALEGLVRKMAPHSGSCCIFGDDGTVIVTRESCKCGPVERAAHDVLDWYGTSWKRGSRPTGTPLAATPVAPAPAPTEPRP